MEVLNYINKLLPYITRRVNCLADAEDLMQDVKESIWRRKEYYESRPFSEQKDIAFFAIKNRITSAFRYNNQKKRIVDVDYMAKIQNPDAYSKIDLKEILEAVNKRPMWQGLINLVNGFTCKEMAAAQGLSEIAVIGRIHRARKKIKLL